MARDGSAGIAWATALLVFVALSLCDTRNALWADVRPASALAKSLSPFRFAQVKPQGPLHLMTNEDRKLEVDDLPPISAGEQSRLEPTSVNGDEKSAATPQVEQASIAQRIIMAVISFITVSAAVVTGMIKGSGKQTTEEAPKPVNDDEPVENLMALNLLWYGLVAMLVTLLAGLTREVILGPLRPFILHDALVSIFAVVSGVVWVRFFKTLASEGIVGRKLSRKLIHITSAPLFLLCWPLYSATPTARCVAAIPPLANSIRLLNAGLGKAENQDAVQAISRQGGRKELLQGPLYYVLVLLVATVVGWRTSLASYVSISLMAGGDGLADIVGRRFGGVKLPWNQNKSWAGSLAMFVGGFALSMAFASLFGYVGYLPPLGANHFLWRLAAVCLGTTIVESLPNSQWWPLDDNVSVPVVAMLLSGLLLHTL